MVTKEDISKAFSVLQAVSEAVREVGQIPSGQLYAILCDKIDLPTYEKVVSTLVKSTVVRKSGNLLIWNVEQCQNS